MRITLILILLSSLISCSVKKNSSKTQLKEPVIFPAPPDSTRIQFLTSFSNAEDVVGKRSKFSEFVMGKEETISLTRPGSVFAKKDSILICDYGSKAIYIINPKLKTFDAFAPGGFGQLKMPMSCFIDNRGFLFVADAKREQIVVFNNNLKYVNAFGLDEGFYPTSIAVSNNKVYVVDSKKHNVFVFDAITYEEINSFPNVENGDEGHLYSPTHITIRDDYIYVTDFGEFNVKVYSLNGEFIRSVGSYGKYIGQFARPKGNAVDNDHNLFVLDAAFENAQIFNNQGKPLMFFGGIYRGPGYMYLPLDICIDYENLKHFEKYVSPSFKLKYLIYVVNQFGNDKVSIYGFVEYNN